LHAPRYPRDHPAKTMAAAAQGTLDPSIEGSAPGSKTPHTWADGQGEYFNVRCGPNYGRNKNKQNSLASFYTCLGVGVFTCDHVVTNLAERVRLPEAPVQAAPGERLPLPPIFVTTVNMPRESPSTFNKKEDGLSYVFGFYWGLKPETLEACKNIGSASPALKHLKNWIDLAPQSEEWRHKFKLIGVIDNIGDIGLGMLERYNGKPALITKSGTLTVDPEFRWAEMSINVHVFNLIARKAWWGQHSKCVQMDARVGFVIQADEDNELPEQILGGAELHFLDFSRAVPLE